MKTSSSHVIYLCDTSQNEGHEPTLFKFMEAVHKCPAVWEVSSLAYKDTNKNKQNKTVTNWVRPNLSVSSLLFLCFTAICDVLLHLKNGHVANYRVCYLTRVWRVKERVCQPFEVFQHEFANLSLPYEGRLRVARGAASWVLSKLPKCIHNSIYAQLKAWTNSFITWGQQLGR